MNRIHRVVFHRATGERRVAPETARGHASSSSLASTVARAVVWSLVWLASMPAWADGGAGGAAGGSLVGQPGGTDDAPNGLAGLPGSSSFGSGDGGSGAGFSAIGGAGVGGAGGGPAGVSGGAGGNGGATNAALGDASFIPAFSGPGFEGAAGANASGASGGGGGGGQGGTPHRLSIGAPSTSRSIVSIGGGAGGAGGDGGSGNPLPGSGGGGGDGGAALWRIDETANLATFVINPAALVLGGAGGRGGAGGTPDLAGGGQPNSVSGTGGAGGRGGAGLRLLNSSIANAGTITGGSGGAGGSGGLGSQQVPAGAAGSAGEGGAGIEGAGLSVGNTGTIQGGLSGDGLRRAPAIRFTGGSNLLSLQPAGVLLGAVEVRDGAAATVRAEAGGLALGPLIVTGPLAVDTGIHLLRVAGSIEGIGPLYKDGIGTLVIGESPADNSGFLGATIVRAGRLDIAGNGALGTASLTLFDNTTLGFVSDNITLANEITLKGLLDPIIDTGPFTATLTGLLNGGGILSKVGSGTLVIAGLNNMTGPTVVAEGTLRAGTINSLGDSSVYTVGPGATLDLAGFDQRINGVVLGGTVSVAGAIPGTVLTSQGAWVGQNGVLRLSTVLGASGSLTDRLVIDDAAVSGNTRVQVVNAGGLGALTTGTGIEIISGINGGTTTAQGTRDGFALVDGHVDAGAFEYRLYPADPGAGESWYLRSAVIVPTVPATELPGVPTTPTNPNLPTLPTQLAGSAGMSLQIPTYRGEVPLFAGLPQQLRQSSFALLDNLHLRVGDEEPASFESLTDGRPLRAWGRVIGIEVDVRQQGDVQPHGVGRLDGFQAGTDLWTDRDFRVGAYVGRLDGELTVDGFAHGLQHQWVGRNDLRSRFIGGYATWFGKDGWYADAVLQAGEHRFEVQPLAAPTSRGRATSLLASLEGGKSFDLGDGWKIEPQLQLVHHHLNVGDVTIGGARVRQDAASGRSLRAGVRLKGETTTDAGALQPYARLNLYRQFGGSDRATFDSPAASTPIWSSTGGSSVEAAGGFTLALNDSTYLYGELGKVWRMGGDVSTRSVLRASLGLRVRW